MVSESITCLWQLISCHKNFFLLQIVHMNLVIQVHETHLTIMLPVWWQYDPKVKKLGICTVSASKTAGRCLRQGDRHASASWHSAQRTLRGIQKAIGKLNFVARTLLFSLQALSHCPYPFHLV